MERLFGVYSLGVSVTQCQVSTSLQLLILFFTDMISHGPAASACSTAGLPGDRFVCVQGIIIKFMYKQD